MMGRSCAQLVIDTKNICVLCLGSGTDTNCFDASPSVPSLQGLKHLLRYLNVNPNELFNCSSDFLQSMEIQEDVDLEISLCSGCASVTNKFNKLYQEYEQIQLQFGDCVQTLYQSISKGNESPEKVRKYKDQMRPTTSSDLVNASIAANFRNETLKKCFLNLQSRTPKVRVAVQKINVDKYSKLSKAGSAANSSSSTSNSRKIQPLQNPIESQSHLTDETFEFVVNDVSIDGAENSTDADGLKNDNCFTNALQSGSDNEVVDEIKSDKPKSIRNTNHLNSIRRKLKTKPNPTAVAATISQLVLATTSTAKPSDIEVISEVKSTTPNMRLKKSSFDSIRKTLKTQTKPTANAANSSSTSNRVGGSFRTPTTCEYCKIKLSSQICLTTHIAVVHSDHIISKFLPSQVSLEHCRQSVHAVWEQMFQTSGLQCQFCNQTLSVKNKLKRHLIANHQEQFAMKVLENIQLFPEYHNMMMQDIPTISADTRSSSSLHCKHCYVPFRSKPRQSLRHHMCYKHPEHIVYKYFPPHITLESCKQGLEYVCEQMSKQTSKSGFEFECKFCRKKFVQKEWLKMHVVNLHCKKIALEAQKCVGLLTKNSEGESVEALANSGNYDYTSNINTSEGSREFDQLPVIQDMDIEIEEPMIIKIESSPQEILELDPLDLDEDGLH